MMNVKVLGGGCSKCETLLANAKEAVANAGVEAEIEYITDFAVIASYGIMSTPALMVDEKIVSMGKVLKSSDIDAVGGVQRMVLRSKTDAMRSRAD